MRKNKILRNQSLSLESAAILKYNLFHEINKGEGHQFILLNELVLHKVLSNLQLQKTIQIDYVIIFVVHHHHHHQQDVPNARIALTIPSSVLIGQSLTVSPLDITQCPNSADE